MGNRITFSCSGLKDKGKVFRDPNGSQMQDLE